MESFEAETLILAGAGTVWDIITEGGNYAVWDSGVAEVSGQVGHGERIRVRTRDGGKRTFRLRVCQIPGQLMTWTSGLPLGLLQVERTFALTDYTGITHLRVRDTASGPHLPRPDPVRRCGQIPGRTVQFPPRRRYFFPGSPLPAAPDDATGHPQPSGIAR